MVFPRTQEAKKPKRNWKRFERWRIGVLITIKREEKWQKA